MHVSGWAWATLLILAPLLLALDLFALPRVTGPIEVRAAGIWSIVWLLVGVAFVGLVWNQAGETYAIKYATGFAVEKGLTIDQVLVFALIVAAFRPPDGRGDRAVFLALWLGLVLKIPAIAVGAFLGHHAEDPVRFVLSAAFLVGGVILIRRGEREAETEENRYLNFLSRHLDFIDDWVGDRFVARIDGRRRYTRAFALLTVLVTTDLYFAVTVPLAFAAQKPAFLVLASSTFAVLGIRSLYWFVSGVVVDDLLLRVSLAVVLWLVAAELLVQPAFHEPRWVLPILIAITVAVPIGSAHLRSRADRTRAPPPATEPPSPAS